MVKAAQQQAEADGSPGKNPECPQLSLSVRLTHGGNAVITERGNLNHWNYFLALDDDAVKFARYVEFSSANFMTFSVELARLLMAASSEVDVVAKLLSKKIDSTKDPNNIIDYRNIIKASFPKITTFRILIPRFGLELVPWKNWAEDNSPDWWQDYNSVKHNRDVSFEKANLSNTLHSIAALFVLLLHYYKEEADNGFLHPNPSVFSVSEDIVTLHGTDSRTYYRF